MRGSINRPVLAFLLLALASLPSWAATLTVSNLNDAGAGSLRAQIAAAAAGDTISFSVTGTITLASTLTISQGLTITGPGASSLTVSGNNAVRVFLVNAGTVTMSGLTVANGSVTNGAGMVVQPGANVTLTNCTFDGNTTDGGGGGVVNFGGLSVNNSTFQNNHSTSSSIGGGAINSQSGSTLSVSNSVFSTNTSAGSSGAILSITQANIVNSTFSGNTAATYGGGVANVGNMSLSHSTFNGNKATSIGGAVLNGGSLIVGDTTFQNNQATVDGGAINNQAGSTLSVSNSTFSANTAGSKGGALLNLGSLIVGGTTFQTNQATADGGAINSQPGGTLSVSNSTFFANTAGSAAGGIVHFGQANIANSTFSANTAVALAGAIESYSSAATLKVSATIFSGNTSANGAGGIQADNSGAIDLVNSSYNLFYGNKNNGAETDTTGYGTTNYVYTTTAPLATLADNGGPTQTLLPVAGSAAIDKIASGTLCPAADQRGVSRPQVAAAYAGSTPCDIGAVEVRQQNYALSVSVVGAGSVGGTPTPTGSGSSGGISTCTSGGGAACSATYANENNISTITLTASLPANTSLSWSGTGCTPVFGNLLKASVTMDQARTCTATFSAMTLLPAALPHGTTGTAYNVAFSASGGTGPYTYTYVITSGSLPAGLSLGSTGGISGTPSANGTVSFDVTATDANGFGVTGSRTLIVDAPLAASINSHTNISCFGGSNGSATVTASGGAAPYTYSWVPSGGNGVTASGLPLGTYSVTVTDSVSRTLTPSVTLTQPAAALGIGPLNNGTAETPYSQSLVATGGTTPYGNFSLTTGTLPPGLTLSSAGLLSGTPTANGTFNFTAGVQDANSCTANRAYSLVIAAPTITLSPASLPAPTVGAAYSQTVTASGGGTPYAYGVTSGALPPGLTLSSGGGVSGTPTAGGTFSFTVTATDAGNFTGSMAYAFTVNAPTISLTPANLPNPSVGTAYSQTVTANGGTAPYTFSTTPGTLPAGLSLSSAGVLSGTPTAAGSVSFTITATDSSTGAGPYVGTRSYTVTPNAPTITVTPASLPNPTFGTAYSQTISAGGGTSPYTFSTTAGTLPTGLTLSSGGTISGTPTAGGTFSFTVTATDAGSFTGSMAYTLTVSGGPTILTVMGNGEPLASATALATDDCSPASGNTSCTTLRGAINHAASGDIIVFDKAAMDGQTINLTMYTNCLSTSNGVSATCLPLATWPKDGSNNPYVSQFGPSAFFISGKALTIDATANGLTKGVVIARSSASGTATFRLFDVGVGSTLILRGLTLSNGSARGGAGWVGGGALGAGGALFNQGTLTLQQCTLTGNLAQGGQGDYDPAYFGGGGAGEYPLGSDGGGPNDGSTGASGDPDGNPGKTGGFGGGGGEGGNSLASGDGNGGDGGGGGFGGGGGAGAFGTGNGSAGRGGNGGFGGGGGGLGAAGAGGFGGGDAFAYGGGGAGMGGAIFNDAGIVSLTNVTLTANAADGGGNSYGFSDNGSGYGGAIFNYAGSLTQDFVTLSGNNVAAGTGGRGGSANGGAIYSLADSAAACSAGGNTCSTGNATLTISHSIAANSSSGATDVVVAAIHSGSSNGSGAYNAIGAATGFTASNAVSGALSLGALPATLSGGLVDVVIPQTGSVAIDAAGAAPCSQASDQRGMSRPQGAACDVGAVEVYVPAPVSLSAAFSPTSVTFGGTSIFTVTATNPNTIALTNVQFGSTVPAGLKLVTQIGGTCATPAVQGGMFTINPGTGVWSGTSNVLAPGQSCTILVSVRPTSVGSFVDATSTVTSNEAPTGPAASATLVVTPAPLTITANDASKTYDAAAYSGGNGVAYAGFVNGDNAAVLGGTLTYGGNSQGAVNAGSYAITPGGLTSSNYAISFVSGTLSVNSAATATALAASWSSAPTTPVYGQSVTFTATVSTTPASGATPTGTVAFSDGGTALPGCSSVAVDGSGNAACQTSSLAVSTHTIAATYTPAGSNFSASGPASISQAVNKAATTTTLTSPAPITLGQAVSVSASVAVASPGTGTPTGTVSISDGGGAAGDTCTITLPAPNCSLTPSTGGSKTLTATYTPDAASGANFGGSSNTAALTVNPASAGSTLTSSANPGVFGQAVTLTGTITPPTGGVTPTGNIVFTFDGTTICTSALSPTGVANAASASCAVAQASLTVGNHPATLSYAGDGNNASSTATLASGQTVNAAATTTTITPPSAITLGGTVNVSVSVAASAPGAGTPGGSVTVSDGSASCVATLSGGSGTCTLTPPAPAGNHSLSAVYTATTNFATSTGTTTLTVNAAPAGTVLTSSANPSINGQTVTFTATVTPTAGNPVPTGSVTFSDGGTALCAAVPLSGGQATCTSAALALGTHTIQASYGGDANAVASSATLTQTVNKLPAIVSVTSSANPSQLGSWVAFTVTVSAAASPGGIGPANGLAARGGGSAQAIAAVATGTLSFADGSRTLGVIALGNGTAIFLTPFTTPGNHVLTVSYGGDAALAAASATITQAVAAADPVVPAPMLSAWMLALLGTLIGGIAAARARGRRAPEV